MKGQNKNDLGGRARRSRLPKSQLHFIALNLIKHFAFRTVCRDKTIESGSRKSGNCVPSVSGKAFRYMERSACPDTGLMKQKRFMNAIACVLTSFNYFPDTISLVNHLSLYHHTVVPPISLHFYLLCKLLWTTVSL